MKKLITTILLMICSVMLYAATPSYGGLERARDTAQRAQAGASQLGGSGYAGGRSSGYATSSGSGTSTGSSTSTSGDRFSDRFIRALNSGGSRGSQSSGSGGSRTYTGGYQNTGTRGSVPTLPANRIEGMINNCQLATAEREIKKMPYIKARGYLEGLLAREQQTRNYANNGKRLLNKKQYNQAIVEFNKAISVTKISACKARLNRIIARIRKRMLDIKNRPAKPSCSNYKGTYAKWNGKAQKYICVCPSGQMWSKTQAQCIYKKHDYAWSKSACARQFPGSIAKWSNKKNRYSCYCKNGYKWNKARTKCVVNPSKNYEHTKVQCAKYYPGSIASWDKELKEYNCECVSPKRWEGNKCQLPEILLTETGKCKRKYGPHSYYYRYSRKSIFKGGYCTCHYGYHKAGNPLRCVKNSD